MKFGWMTLAHSPSPEHDASGIFEQLEQATLAEALGFDGVWLTEHNFTGESVYVDPIPFAAALASARNASASASRSFRWRCATRCGSPPSCRCSTISRADASTSASVAAPCSTSTSHRLRPQERRRARAHGRGARRDDAGLDGNSARPQGKYFTVRLPELRPVPVQRPHPPIWRSVASAASFRLCGEKGVPILTARLPLAQIGVRLGQYAEGLSASGLDGAAQEQLLQKAAIWRWVYVGESRAAAEDELAAALALTRRHMQHARQELNPPDFQVDPAMLNPWIDPSHSEEDGIRFALRSGTVIGTAREVAEQVAELREAGVGHLLCQMSFGFLDHEKIKRSMRRFAETVMPAFA